MPAVTGDTLPARLDLAFTVRRKLFLKFFHLMGRFERGQVHRFTLPGSARPARLGFK